MPVTNERRRQLRSMDRKELWTEIISLADAITKAGLGDIKFVPDYNENDIRSVFIECQEEAQKLTDMGYGGVRFICPAREHEVRKSLRREDRKRRILNARTYPFILDEKRSWVK